MYLMHRISHENNTAKKLLDDKNLITIGWSDVVRKGQGDFFIDLASQKNIESKERFIKEFVCFGEKHGLSHFKSRRAYSLYNFLSLSTGDIVMVPTNKAVTIVEVIDKPKVFEDDIKVDIGFVIKIKIVCKDVSRYDYLPPEISSKMKYRGTNLVLQDEKSINDLIESFSSGRKIHDLIDTKSKMVDELYKYMTEKIDHDKFEALVKSYFEQLGANARIVGKGIKIDGNEHEADVDIIAIFENIKVIIYIQAKQHKNQSNSTGINQLIKYKHENNQQYLDYSPVKWLINTGYLSDEHIQLAADEDIRIIMEKDFSELIVDAGLRLVPNF